MCFLEELLRHQCGTTGIGREEEPRTSEGNQLQSHGHGSEACKGTEACSHKTPLITAATKLPRKDEKFLLQLPGIDPAVQHHPSNLAQDRNGMQRHGDDHQGNPAQQKQDGMPDIAMALHLWQRLSTCSTLSTELVHDASLFQNRAKDLHLHASKENQHQDDVHHGRLRQNKDHGRNPGNPIWTSRVDQGNGLGTEGGTEEHDEAHQGADERDDDGAHHFLPEPGSGQEHAGASDRPARCCCISHGDN
mmetsp:Transcript_73021/g.89572  ORF Transcript_73021/g.89572 Transcript_73021/m.89572 type:complete len:248 (+) Transcript_73021:176-919(+)